MGWWWKWTNPRGGLRQSAEWKLHNEFEMTPLTFEEARECVLRNARRASGTESVCLADAAGRVLAETVAADRDYPPFPRSARDGYALRAADLPRDLHII